MTGRVRLDLNFPEFQSRLFALDADELRQVVTPLYTMLVSANSAVIQLVALPSEAAIAARTNPAHQIEIDGIPSQTMDDRKFDPACFRTPGRWRQFGVDSALLRIAPVRRTTATALGVAISQLIMLHADKVIEENARIPAGTCRQRK